MKEFDETTIWTSDQIPLMASYNKGVLISSSFLFCYCPRIYHFDIDVLFAGKMQHSVWVVEVINSNLEVANANLLDLIPSGVIPKRFSFRRIWQGKGVQTAACKVLVYSLDFVSSGYPY